MSETKRNEAIERLEELATDSKETTDVDTGYYYALCLAIDALRELSRSRIRVTATEPPTREDADKVLCTVDDGGDWSFKRWYQIADCPSTYVLWFIMPDVQLPD